MFNRGALIGFGLTLAEVVTFVLAIRAFGPLFVVLGSIVLALVGMAVVRRQLPALLGSGQDFVASFGFSADDDESSDHQALRATDRALATLGGLLLIVPGFLTGLAGAVLLLPPFRALVREFARRRFAQIVPAGFGASFPANGFASRWRGFSGSDVIDVDVVSEDTPRTARRELP
jgi:UPF0716 protein FxsA